MVLRGMQIPEPVIFRSIEARSTADQPALTDALRRFQREDPSFRVRQDPDSGQTLVCDAGQVFVR